MQAKTRVRFRQTKLNKQVGQRTPGVHDRETTVEVKQELAKRLENKAGFHCAQNHIQLGKSN
jgi:hypothetical protein